MRYVGFGVLALLVILGLSWVITGNDFFLYKYWAPKTAAVQREVFTQTPSYVQGMVQELENMKFEYETADSTHQAALASIIIHRAGAIDEKLLPSDLQAFIAKLKRDRSGSRY